MKHAMRLKPGQDLIEELKNFVREKDIEAAAIMTCVGSLNNAVLRTAGAKSPSAFRGPFEITSLVGTLSVHGCHIHIALSDAKGVCLGGHLVAGCEIHTTAEIVIEELEKLVFQRKPDSETGYNELEITQK